MLNLYSRFHWHPEPIGSFERIPPIGTTGQQSPRPFFKTALALMRRFPQTWEPRMDETTADH